MDFGSVVLLAQNAVQSLTFSDVWQPLNSALIALVFWVLNDLRARLVRLENFAMKSGKKTEEA